jgi:hypothetical protein
MNRQATTRTHRFLFIAGAPFCTAERPGSAARAAGPLQPISSTIAQLNNLCALSDDAQADLKMLQGAWRVVRAESEGKDIKGQLGYEEVVIEGNSFPVGPPRARSADAMPPDKPAPARRLTRRGSMSFFGRAIWGNGRFERIRCALYTDPLAPRNWERARVATGGDAGARDVQSC